MSQAALKQAAALLQLPPDFPFQQHHLQEVGRLLQAKQGQGLTLAALHSAMSLANIVSLVAIIGMAVWIGPAMKQLLWPLLKHMARRLRAVYNRVAAVLVAVTKALLPVYAWVGFYISLLVLKAAPRWVEMWWGRTVLMWPVTTAGATGAWHEGVLQFHANCLCWSSAPLHML